jgi:hypothetical protein
MIISSLSFITIVGTASAQAQITTALVADIPFDFAVGRVNLPAGKYTIKPLGFPAGDGVMEVVSQDGTTAKLFLTEHAQVAEPPNDGELIFHHVGDRYFLYEIFDSGDTVGVMLPRPREERKMEEESRLTDTSVTTVRALSRAEARN